MKLISFTHGKMFKIFLVVAIAVGMASFPSRGAQAGIDTSSFDPKVDFGTGNSPYGIAIGDLDGDGKPDLAVTNYYGNTVSVLRNTSTSGSISFAPKVDFATGIHPTQIAISDLDGDGKLDLAVANGWVYGSSSIISVLRNTSTSGNISFEAQVSPTAGNSAYSIAVGDLDGDGKPDLAVANVWSNNVSVLRNTSTSGSVSFAARVNFGTGVNPYGIAIRDLDGDGKIDMAVPNYGSNTASVLRNTSTSGSVSFAAKVDFGTGTSPHGIAIGDLDGDGKADLAIGNYGGGNVSLLHNTSTSGSVSFATKVDFGTGSQPLGIAIGNLDWGTRPDLVVGNNGSNTASVLRNTSTSGSVSLAAKVDFNAGTNPYDMAIGDLDGDGKADIAVVNFNSSTVSVLRNTIDTIPPMTVFGAGSVPPADGAILTNNPIVLLVQFSENVMGDGSEQSANSTWNYLLLQPGPNGIFDTTVSSPGICDSDHVIEQDDVKIEISAITYDANNFTATIEPTDVPLPDGLYRLYLCSAASIDDLAGNPLNSGTNVAINFSVISATAATAAIPATGFTPNRVSPLPAQKTEYSDLGDLWLEIPSLGVQAPIVGVPLQNGTWDVSWLGNDAGWLNGSAFPTWAGNSVLTGHVYDAFGKPGPFAGINRLWYGSQIIVHAWGGVYIYEVRSILQVSPDNIKALMKHQDLPWLTMATCRGYDETTDSYKYRVLVRAVLVEVK